MCRGGLDKMPGGHRGAEIEGSHLLVPVLVLGMRAMRVWILSPGMESASVEGKADMVLPFDAESWVQREYS